MVPMAGTETGEGNPVVHGWTARGYERVREAFAANLSLGEDTGAAVSVYRYGNCVVDLWGGTAFPGGPEYPEDGLQLVYSTTKGIVALCLASLSDWGELDLDDRVVRYWPEFGECGKQEVSVREVASHQAGLPAFSLPTTVEDLCRWDRSTSALAAQAPEWLPGSAHGYHAVTLGYLLGEIVRRVSGQTVGTVLRERFGQPLDLRMWIGLPDSMATKVVPLYEDVPANGVGEVLAAAERDPTTMTGRVFANPPIDVGTLDNPSVYAAEIPAVNGVTDARSLARLYASVVDGPLRSIGAATVDSMRRSLVRGADLVLIDQPTHFGTGFMLSSPREPMLGQGSLGHNGRGGSLGFAHPESGISYGFVANRMALTPGPDRRNIRLIAAVKEAMA